jgi:hypothetical protein
MGQELTCRATCGKQSGQGKAMFETNEILFRGDFRLKIPLKSITKAEARGGKLSLTFPGGPAAFELGGHAEKWLVRIQNPRTLMDKLGVKPKVRVNLDGAFDEEFLKQLDARSPERVASDADIVFYAASTQTGLRKLPSLQARIKSNGAIWVIYPKGRKEITEMEVIRAGREAGLVDVKIASISATLTGTKMMVPLAKRKG